MRPLQTSSLSTRSNDIDLLRKHGAACQRRAKKQLVLVNSPPHGAGGQARATIEIEVDGGADSLMTAGERLMLGQCDVDGLEEELQDRLGVVAQALVAGARIAFGHPRDDQRLAAKSQGGVRRFERCHAAVAETAVGAD